LLGIVKVTIYCRNHSTQCHWYIQSEV